MQVSLVRKFLDLGFDLLLCDIDTMWMRDPNQYWNNVFDDCIEQERCSIWFFYTYCHSCLVMYFFFSSYTLGSFEDLR